MKTFSLHIHLQEAVIFSETAATLGGHRSLDYIPGAALLGACAAKLYNSLGEEAFNVFHAGKVKFTNAYPLTKANELTYPIPFSLFHAKGESPLNTTNRLNTDAVFNLAQADHEKTLDGKQPKQLRSGYISDQLQIINPQATLRMKTAINPETARAAKSQLFGYQSLESGQSFVSTISVDEGISPETTKKIINNLQGTLHLGRSRSAQFGKVKTELVTILTKEKADQTTKNITLWLLSDLALNDENSIPVSGNKLGNALVASIPALKGFAINWTKSHLRFRRYSPFNAYRKAYDMERQVIEKGSVIQLSSEHEITIRSSTVHIGLYQSQGLGQIVINPTLLSAEKPIAQNAHKIEIAQLKQTLEKQPESPLLDWLKSKYSSKSTEQFDHNIANKLSKELQTLYHNANQYAGVSQGILLGPSSTQWGRIADAGKQHQNDREKLFNLLFGSFTESTGAICKQNSNDENSAICKLQDDEWCKTSFDQANNQICFADWLRNSLNKHDIEQPGRVATLLARKAQDYIRQQKRGNQA